MKRFLGPEGSLARHITDFEYRPHQLAMGESVWRALRDDRTLLVEAGTGTGKSLAYLLPAINSGRKVAVSTGTKPLQDQLFGKDIPFLQRHMDTPFKACCLKGRNNYLCLRRLDAFRQQPLFDSAGEGRFFQQVLDWYPSSTAGDQEELSGQPEGLGFWRNICSRSELCLGQKCPHQEHCFIVRLRQRAAESDIMVINHHLFFADLLVKERSTGGAIPDFEAIIFDEAHLLEDIASLFLGSAVSNFRLEELVRDARIELFPRLREDSREQFTATLARLDRISRDLFSALEEMEDSGRLRPEDLSQTTHELADNLIAALDTLAADLALFADDLEDAPALIPRCREIRDSLQFILQASDPDFVFWQESRGRGRFLHASPIDVSQDFRERVLGNLRSVVLTSATLSTDGDFRFIRERLGIDQCEEEIYPSHFDYQRQALLFVPRGISPPNSPDFPAQAAEAVREILERTRGRAFVLCTSLKNMCYLYQYLSERLPYPLLVQGEMPRSEILERFRKEVESVLVATTSFWQGVDVKGEALSCVIVDKLPFAVPSEPLVAARIERLNQAGSNAFQAYQVPSAIIMLKQGFGRLIRNGTDRGVLSILDGRILSRSYGQRFLRSLPPIPLTRQLEQVERFGCSG